jgi:hypothetical protein
MSDRNEQFAQAALTHIEHRGRSTPEEIGRHLSIEADEVRTLLASHVDNGHLLVCDIERPPEPKTIQYAVSTLGESAKAHAERTKRMATVSRQKRVAPTPPKKEMAAQPRLVSQAEIAAMRRAQPPAPSVQEETPMKQNQAPVEQVFALLETPARFPDLVSQSGLSKSQVKYCLKLLQDDGRVEGYGYTTKRFFHRAGMSPAEIAKTVVALGGAAPADAAPKKQAKRPPASPPPLPRPPTPVAPAPAAAVPAKAAEDAELGGFACGLYSNGKFQLGISPEECLTLNVRQTRVMYAYLKQFEGMMQ